MRKEEKETVIRDHRLCGGGKGQVDAREGSADGGQHRGSGFLRSRRRRMAEGGGDLGAGEEGSKNNLTLKFC